MQNLIKENLKELGIFGRAHRPLLCEDSVLEITKSIGGRDITARGAFCEPYGDELLKISISLPRRSGIFSVTLRIAADGGDNFSYPFCMTSNNVRDTFILECPASALPNGLSCGLYYYHLELCFGEFTLFTDTDNNADTLLCEVYPIHRFRFLVHERDFKTPDWFKGNVMYHIFADRFFKGDMAVPQREESILNTDWDGGIPQYGEYPGASVSNNVFFGGTLYGVTEKLEYLASLGVGCIYLSPVFKAYSNHRYDTGDYMTVDELLGGDKALKELFERAGELGIRVILDGVFNHTGDDSLYFNRYGRYDSVGAYDNEDSPYRDWYFFDESERVGYKSWWGIEILPKLNLENQSCADYFLGRNGVVEKYLDMGASGIRLDVADELPDSFLDRLRQTVRQKKSDGLIIGEVWENAADKMAYGKRRRYFRGGQLDSVMNYPLKNAVIGLLKNKDTELFYNTLTELYSSYPKCCCDSLMNILGTHDTERILTLLAADTSEGLSNDELAVKRMSDGERVRGIKMLKAASVIQYTVFGTPSVFYGDEAGLEGYHDPFCRMPFPWKKIDDELLCHYRALGEIRRSEKVFEKGDFRFCHVADGLVAYKRLWRSEEILVIVNASDKRKSYSLKGVYKNLFTGENINKSACVEEMTALILKKIKGGEGNE